MANTSRNMKSLSLSRLTEWRTLAETCSHSRYQQTTEYLTPADKIFTVSIKTSRLADISRNMLTQSLSTAYRIANTCRFGDCRFGDCRFGDCRIQSRYL